MYLIDYPVAKKAMNKGELVEVGNHEELMQLKREYYRLWSTQAQYYI